MGDISPMRFLTYVKITVIVDAVVAVAFGALFYSVLPSLLGIWIALVLLIVIPATALHLWLLAQRLDDYGGTFPFPGLLGLLGVDLVDDDGPSSEDSSNSSDGETKSVGTAIDNEDELDAYGNPISFRPHCAYCHALLPNPNAKFCDECGKPVVRPPSLPSTGPPWA
jgi:hypothetical protein